MESTGIDPTEMSREQLAVLESLDNPQRSHNSWGRFQGMTNTNYILEEKAKALVSYSAQISIELKSLRL